MLKQKFVFAVSFVAMLTVGFGAARADIASTVYVQQGVATANEAAGKAQDSANNANVAAGNAQDSADKAKAAAEAAQKSADEAAASAQTANDTVATKQDILTSGEKGNVVVSGTGAVVTGVTADGGTVTVAKGNVSYGDLTDKPTLGALAAKGAITNADVASDAAIDQSKISGLTSALSGKVATAQGSSNANRMMITDASGTVTPVTITTSGTGGVVTGVSVAGGKLTVTKGASIPTVNNATLTIQKNGTDVGTFTANASSAKTIDITVPTGALASKDTITNADVASDAAIDQSKINGLTSALSGKVATAQGSSNANRMMITDASGTVTPVTITTSGTGGVVTGVSVAGGKLTVTKGASIPTVNNATLTIQKNGTDVGTFTANASSAKTIDITVPTGALASKDTITNADVASDAAIDQSKISGLTDALAGKEVLVNKANSEADVETIGAEVAYPTVNFMENSIANANSEIALAKFDNTSTVKKAIVTTDKNGKVAPVVISDSGTGTYITGVTVADTGAVTLTRGTPTAYSLPDATTTTKGGVIVGSNIGVSNGKISVATANGTSLGVVKQGTNVSIASGAVSVADATATVKGVAMLGVIPAGADKSGTATIWVE